MGKKVKAEHKVPMTPIEVFKRVLWSRGVECPVNGEGTHLQTVVKNDGAEYGVDIVYEPRRKTLVMVQMVIPLIELPRSTEHLLSAIHQANVLMKNQGYFCYLEEQQAIVWQYDLAFKSAKGVTMQQAATCLHMARTAISTFRYGMLGAFYDFEKFTPTQLSLLGQVRGRA